MKKRKRVWLMVGGTALLSGFALLVFLGTGVHPDYSRGAQGLEAARARMEQLVGPMTWEEYRLDRGVKESNDKDKWEELENGIPKSFEEYDDESSYRNSYAKIHTSLRELFLDNRAWLFTLADAIEPLRVNQSNIENQIPADILASRNLGERLAQMVIGAADAGDVEAIREIGRVGWMIVNKQQEESDILVNMTVRSSYSRLQRGIVLGTVRNRDNKAVVRALEEVMADRPEVTSLSEILIGEVRSIAPMLSSMRNFDESQASTWWSDHVDYQIEYEEESEFVTLIKEGIQKIRGKADSEDDFVVNETMMLAFEARLLESMATGIELAKEISYTDNDAHMRATEFGLKLDSLDDRSYELATRYSLTSLDFSANYDLVSMDTYVIALKVIALYPQFVDLPLSLPASLLTPDPFGGKPLLYKKTTEGFVVYSRHENRIDDGYIQLDPDMYDFQTLFTKSKDNEDWGLIISYDPSDPLP